MKSINTPRPSDAGMGRIAIISPVLPPLACGESMSTYFTAVKLAERGVDVHVVTTKRRVISNVSGVTIHTDMRRWGWKELPRLRKRLRRIAPDGVLLFYMSAMYNRHPMITFLPTFVRRALPTARFVTRFEHVGGANDPADLPWRARLLIHVARVLAGSRQIAGTLGTLLRDSDAVIALCGPHKEHLRALASDVSEKLTIIPPPSNLVVAADSDGSHRRRGRELLGASPTDVVVGYMGYIYPPKGIEDLLAAFSAATRRAGGSGTLRLVMLGGRIGEKGTEMYSYFRRMQELAQELGIESQVIWSGGFAHDDDSVLPAYFHAVDFWVLPFRRGAQLNNSSLTSLMTYGRAIITTAGESVEDALVDGESVALVPCGDRNALAASIGRLATDVHLRERLAAGALRFAHRRLSWPAAIDHTIAALKTGK